MRGRVALSVLGLVFAAGEARAEVCTRPTAPEGYAGYRYDGATPSFFDTERVRVWYAMSGEHSVRLESSRADGVPDDVASVATITEEALQAYAAMGFRAPVSDEDTSCGSNGGDGRLDVYLVRFGGADGMAARERCTIVGPATQCATFVLAEANFEGRYPTVEDGIRTVLPHEVFHAVQNAYDADLDRFWAEGTAQWAAKLLAPSLPDLERFLPAFFKEEGRSIDLPPGGVTAGFLYGSAIWPVFLSQRFDLAIVREIFEAAAATGASALDAAAIALEARQRSLEDEWLTFWTWNASTGTRADASGYPDAARYPMLTVNELGDAASGVTSGSTGYVYRVAPRERVTVSLASEHGHRAQLLPLDDGKAVLASAASLPADTDREALVVVTSLTRSKVDAPFTLRVASAPIDEPPADDEPAAPPPAEEAPFPPPAPASGGCSSSPATSRGGGAALPLMAGLMVMRRRRRLTTIGESEEIR